MAKFEGLGWQVKFWHIFIDILGPDVYFSKPIFALKPWAQASRFEYNKPYNWKNFFSDLFKGSWNFLCAMHAVGKTPNGFKFIMISSHTTKNIQEGSAEIICEDIDILSHPTNTNTRKQIRTKGTYISISSQMMSNLFLRNLPIHCIQRVLTSLDHIRLVWTSPCMYIKVWTNICKNTQVCNL